MVFPRDNHCGISIAASLAALALLSLPAEAAKIGVAAAVQPSVTGTPPGAAEVILTVGHDIQSDERVVTTRAGRAQLLFLDGTALTLGPNSKLVLDRFVYDPHRGTGTIALNLAGGVLRLVGGQVSKDRPIQIQTPVATVGIRGGIGIVTYVPGQPLQALFLYGHDMTVASGGQSVEALRPGTIITVGGGHGLSPPHLATPGEIATLLTPLSGPAGQKGTPAFTGTVDAAAGRVNSAAKQANAAPLGGSPATSSAAAGRNASGINPYLSWAFVEATIQHFQDSVPESGQSAPILETVTNPGNLPTTGTAVYRGQVYGSSNLGSGLSGSFQNTWNFASRSGSVAIANFDRSNLTGSVASPAGSTGFSGTLSGTRAGSLPLTGAISGSFFLDASTGAGHPPGNIGGNFSITGSHYGASGTFSAQSTSFTP